MTFPMTERSRSHELPRATTGLQPPTQGPSQEKTLEIITRIMRPPPVSTKYHSTLPVLHENCIFILHTIRPPRGFAMVIYVR